MQTLFDIEPGVPRVEVEVEKGGATVIPYTANIEYHLMYRDITAHCEIQDSLIENPWSHFRSM